MIVCDYCGKGIPGTGYGGYMSTAVPMCKACRDAVMGITADSKDQRIADLEAQCAAMREVLALGEELDQLAYDACYYFKDEYPHEGDNVESEKCTKRKEEILKQMQLAIAPDAGRALLERLAKAEEPALRAVLDGNAYGIVVGDNLQDGISGWGDTPQEAIEDLHKEMLALLERLRKAEEQAGSINDLAQQLTMVVLKYELLVGLLVDAGEDPAEYGLTWPQEEGNEWINAPLEKAWYKALDYAISQRFVRE